MLSYVWSMHINYLIIQMPIRQVLNSDMEGGKEVGRPEDDVLELQNW